jgi:signal transduction histidine kinase
MKTMPADITQRERELAAIITAYNEVTDNLKQSHVKLTEEVRRLHEELARKNEQLRRKERLAALGEMAAGVAHEIRNPLGGIQLFASLLHRDLQHQPDALEVVNKIRKGVVQLESIVSGILDFARPATVAPRAFSVIALITETVELIASKAAAAGVEVEVFNHFEDMEFVTDGAMLQRALLNLLLNAIEAAGGHGERVRVHWKPGSDETVTIEVRDEGPGIPAEVMDRMFNPFFTTKDAGTGLGLAIVHQIAESLGGSVRAANHPQGGASLSLTVPRYCEESTEDFTSALIRQDRAES